ncbi:MAG: hypothetical protein H0T96_02900 [Thermoleophilaceae bacterium]|nr:hypothetical protein [Thermoleophilaceae bacterium]
MPDRSDETISGRAWKTLMIPPAATAPAPPRALVAVLVVARRLLAVGLLRLGGRLRFLLGLCVEGRGHQCVVLGT